LMCLQLFYRKDNANPFYYLLEFFFVINVCTPLTFLSYFINHSIFFVELHSGWKQLIMNQLKIKTKSEKLLELTKLR
jgi:hypothetical protein